MSSTVNIAVILADLPSFSAGRAFFAGEDEAMAEMVVESGIGKTSPLAKGENFWIGQCLGDRNARIMSDHATGKEREELDPQIGAAMAEEVGGDDAAASESIHRFEHVRDPLFIEMMQKHRRHRVIEAVVGKGQSEDIRLHDLQPRIVALGGRGASSYRMSIDGHNVHVKMIARRPL